MAIKFDVQANNKDFVAKMREVQQSVHSAKDSIEKDGASMDAVFSKLAQGAAALGVSTGLYEFAKQTANVRGEFQKLEVAFTTLLKSKAEADDLMKQLVRTAATTPFDLRGVADGAKQLMAYGIEADKVNDKIIQLGNLASGLSLDIGYITTLYGTTVSKDHMDTMDLKQFKAQGIAIDQAIADVLAVDVEKVKSMISSGQITGDIVDEAIKNMTTGTGQFSGLMEAQSKTIAGQISNIEDAIDTMFNDIGKQSEGVISGALGAVSYLVENWRDVAEAIGVAVAAYGAYKAALMTQDAFTNVTAAMQFKEESDAWIELTAHLQDYAVVKEEVDAEEAYAASLDTTSMTDEQKAKILELRQAYIDKAEAAKEAADLNVQSLTNELQANEEAVKSAQEKVNSASEAVQAAKETGDAVEIETAMRDANTAAVELNEAVQVRDNTAKELSVVVDKQKAASEALDTAATTANTVATQAHVIVLRFLRGALIQATTALRALWATMMANPLAIVAAAVVAVGYGIYEFLTYETDAEKATRELNDAAQELEKTTRDEQHRIDELFNKLEIATKGTDEYKKAKDDILAGYGKYLKGLGDEIEKLNDVAAAYRAISAAARQAAIDRAIDQQTGKAGEKLSGDVSDYGGKLYDEMKRKLGDTKRTNQYYLRLMKAYREGDEKSATQTKKEILAQLGDNTSNMRNIVTYFGKLEKAYKQYDKQVKDIKDKFGESSVFDYNTMDDKQLNSALSTIKKGKAQFSKSGKVQVMKVAGQIYEASTQEEFDVLISNLSNEIAKRKKKSGPTTQEKLDDYKNRIGTANTDEKRDALIKELKEDRKKAEDGTSFKAEVDKLLTQVEAAQTKNAHKSSKKAAQEAAKRLKEISDYKASLEKLALAKQRLDEDLENQYKTATIEAMKDGFEKEQKLRERQHKDRLTTILRNAEDQKRALVDQAEQEYEKNPINKVKQFDRGAFISTDQYKKDAAKIDKTSNAQILAENNQYLFAINQEAESSMTQYLKQYGSFEEQLLAIAKEYDEKIKQQTKENGTLTAEGMMAVAERNKALSAAQFEHDKAFGPLLLAFGNIEKLGNETIDRLITKMEQYRETALKSLEPEQIRQFNEQLGKLYELKEDRQKQGLRYTRAEAQEMARYFELRKDELEAQSKVLAKKKLELKAEREITKLRINRILKENNIDYKDGEYKDLKLDSLSDDKKKDVTQLTQSYEEAGVKIQGVDNELANVNTQMNANGQAASEAMSGSWGKVMSFFQGGIGGAAGGGGGGGAAQALAITDKIIHGINDNVHSAAALVDDIKDTMSAFGNDTDTRTKVGKMAAGMNMFAEASQNATDGWESLKKGDLFGVIKGVVGSFTSWIKGFARLHDSQFQEDIEDIDRSLHKLSTTYDDLGDKAEESYSKIKQNYLQQQASNLAKQRALIERQMVLEQQKKDTDEDAITKYKDNLHDLDKEIAETKRQAQDAIFGADIKSQIDEFATSWAEAWTAGESRVRSSKEMINGMLKQMIVEAMKADIAGPMDAIRDQMENYWSDNIITDDERNALEAQAEQLSNMLDLKYSAYEDIFKDKGQELHGTSRGFSSMSQESADELNGRFAQSQMTLQSICLSVQSNIEELSGISSKISDGNSYLSNLVDLAGIRNGYLSDIIDMSKRYYSGLSVELSSIRQIINAKL